MVNAFSALYTQVLLWAITVVFFIFFKLLGISSLALYYLHRVEGNSMTDLRTVRQSQIAPPYSLVLYLGRRNSPTIGLCTERKKTETHWN